MGSKPHSQKLLKKRNRPPAGEPFVWLTREILESDAWRTAPIYTRRFIDRMIIEHMSHAGTENGNLICTYQNCLDCGIPRNNIKEAQDDANARGLVYKVESGKASPGRGRRPNIFGLGWLPGRDGGAAPNRWKGYASSGGYLDNINSSITGNTLFNGQNQPKTEIEHPIKVLPGGVKQANKISTVIFNSPTTPLPTDWSVRKSDVDGHVRVHNAQGVALPTVDHPSVGTPQERAALADYRTWREASAESRDEGGNDLNRAIETLARLRNEREKRNEKA